MIWTGDSSGRRLATCLITLYDQVDRRWPNRDKRSDGSIGDHAHQARASDHNTGDDDVVEAIDITHDPAGGFDCHKFSETLRIARDPRLEYMIWNRQILYSGGSQPWQWQAYHGDNPHTSHIHISCQPDPAIYDNPAPWVIERAAAKPGLFTDIVATVFGGPTDSMSSPQTAYGPLIAPGWWDRLGVALPARFSERPLPKVRLYNRSNGKSLTNVPVIDLGPHNINDAYWRTGSRPQAETGFDMGWTGTVRRTNRAGIDLTPATAAAIGLNGKGLLDWEFVTQEDTVTESPIPAPSPATTDTYYFDEPRLRKQMLDRLAFLPTPRLVDIVLGLGPQQLLPSPQPSPQPQPTPQPQPQPQPTPQPQPSPAPAAPSKTTGALVGAIGGLAAIVAQMLGVGFPASQIAGPAAEVATNAGNVITLLSAVAPGLGWMGAFNPIIQAFARAFGSERK